MSFHVSLDSLEDIHNVLVGTLIDDPDCSAAPRGKPIKELIAPSFTLMNPRNRLITSPIRSVNYGFGVGELCWYLRGDKDLETMRYYNKRMNQFSDDGYTINSAYGNRIFKNRYSKKSPPRTARDSGPPLPPGGISQFDLVLDELTRDPDSRRAVMHINEPGDLLRAVEQGSKDVPCTMSLQLLIRDRKLHMHVLMRSNDIVWGMPYDVFSFTCLQETFLYKLQEAGVPVDDLGSYHHTAGSLHIYDTHFEMADAIKDETVATPSPMSPFTLEDMEWLSQVFEPLIRNSAMYDGPVGDAVERETGETIDWMVTMLVNHRDKRVSERTEKDVQQT
jgi:thymidylate synthase